MKPRNKVRPRNNDDTDEICKRKPSNVHTNMKVSRKKARAAAKKSIYSTNIIVWGVNCLYQWIKETKREKAGFKKSLRPHLALLLESYLKSGFAYTASGHFLELKMFCSRISKVCTIRTQRF